MTDAANSAMKNENTSTVPAKYINRDPRRTPEAVRKKPAFTYTHDTCNAGVSVFRGNAHFHHSVYSYKRRAAPHR